MVQKRSKVIEEVRLKDAFKGLNDLYEEWPKQSEYYANQQGPIDVKYLPRGVNRRQVDLALCLWDIHSMMSANLLTTCWRAEQLGRVLLRALGENDLVVGANLARSLMENAAAFLVEAVQVRSSWDKWMKESKTFTPESATEFRFNVIGKTLQFTLGTRNPEYLKEVTPENVRTFTRTNVMTLLDKIDSDAYEEDLKSIYDYLCDAVHPNFGANEVFYTEMGVDSTGRHMRTLMSRDATGRSSLPTNIKQSAIWALEQLTAELESQKSFCEHICRVFKLWCLGLDYFGIIRPKWFRSDSILTVS